MDGCSSCRENGAPGYPSVLRPLTLLLVALGPVPRLRKLSDEARHWGCWARVPALQWLPGAGRRAPSLSCSNPESQTGCTACASAC